MSKYFLALSVFSLITPTLFAKDLDFQFKGMDLRTVIESLAKLEGKSVVFSPAVTSKNIDVTLKQISAARALEVILNNYGYRAIEKEGVLRVVASEPTATEVRQSSTNVFQLQHVLAKEIEKNVKTLAGPDGNVSINESLNSLVVSAPVASLERIHSLIQKLDRVGNQVLIEAKIVESSTSFSRQLGMEWGSQIANPNAFPGINLSAPVQSPPLNAGISTGVGRANALQLRLTAAESNGEAKVIASPKIATVNGIAATIESSTTFNVRTLAQVSSPGASAGAALVGSIQPIKAGINLKVTPFIVSDSQVRLDIVISKSDPDFGSAIDGIPGISDNSAATSLIVNDGETASIAGLVQKSVSSSTNGIPFLSRIPLLGILFGSLDNEKKESELLIFLTPKIYKSAKS